ncbi:polysaccharide pyruvyl transferase family protein [Bifidobacterium pullorum]|uniref:polysaccharide pyruvyl transferase family protein n=1 Tax=Bifidobacterium pullorum TaxID=78448 RepID=UPI00068CA154|nr:polysaccharide pyruvyl transferase family protein [Bifidobacterium pullorum]
MGKLRVGILSMQRIRNYGSFLQAYGLRKLLESLGCEVRFVDYRPGRCLVESKKPSRLPHPAAKLAEVLDGPGPFSAKLTYANYKRHFDVRTWPLLGLSAEPDYRTDDLDVLVIGSDEVFNCVQSNPNVGFSPDLFGAMSEARRTITYAASCGNTTALKLHEHGVADEVAGWLRNFDAVSVRDENTALVVKELAGIEAVRNLDPVLAWDFFSEEDIPENPIEGRYMIAYAYSGRLTKEECTALRSYADERGLKVVNVGGVQGCCDRFLDLGPFEVLAAFRGAECVLTDTFHGTILSAIAERPFATIVRTAGYGNTEKLTDLLSRLGLESRIASAPADFAGLLDSVPDWTPVRDRIVDGRTAARSYLQKEVFACTRN